MFSGCTFALCGIKDKQKLKKIIEENGGNLCYTVSQKTTHLIASQDSVSNGSSIVVSTLKLKLPIVDQSYISACLTAGKRLPELDFQTSVSQSTTTKSDTKVSKVVLSTTGSNHTLNEIRVFISSTITDMPKEREYLLKRVFPELRAQCSERGIFFSWVDLRWGITDQQKNDGKVLELCLSEIDHCQYFVCILGERYGWSQTKESPDPVLNLTLDVATQRFPWIKQYSDRSVTELEIRHAMENSPNKSKHRSLFLFRDPNSNWMTSGLTFEEKALYQSDGEIKNRKLNELKNYIRNSKYPLIENYQNPQQFGQFVLENLRAAIEIDCPVVKSVLQNPLELEKTQQMAYVKNRSSCYIKKNSLFQEITNFIKSETPKDSYPLTFVGPSGSGKTSLLANWLLENQSPKDFFLIPFFIGSGNYHVCDVVKFIISEIKAKFDILLPLPTNDIYLVREFPYWLQLASEKGKIVLLLDSIHTLDSSSNTRPSDKDSGDSGNLGDSGKDSSYNSTASSYVDWTWLPSSFPENVRVVISTTKSAEFIRVSRDRRFHKIVDMSFFSVEEKQTFIQKYLSRFGKSLNTTQLNNILKTPQTESPVFLRAMVDELQNCHFETLDKTLLSYLGCPDVIALYQKIFSRWEKDFSTSLHPTLVIDCLRFLCLSRKGVSEADIYSLLNIEPSSVYDWYNFYSSVLRENVVNRNGKLQFFHDYLVQAANARYLVKDSDKKIVHEKLADHFAKYGLNRRKLEEYPYHLEKCGKKEELRLFLSNLEHFYFMFTGGEHLRNDFHRYWYTQLAEKNEVIGALYFQLATDFVDTNPPGDILGDMLRATSDFLCKIGQYEYATKLLRIVHYNDENLYGQWHELVATDLYLMATNSYHQADYIEAGSKARRAYEMTKSAMGPDHITTADCLTLVGLIYKKQGDFAKALPHYEEALRIVEITYGENHSRMGEFLSNLGDICRKLGDFQQAVNYYQRAIKIITTVQGEGSIEYANIQNLMGLVYKKRGEYESAEISYKVALNVAQKNFGQDHPKTAEFMYNLADVYRKRGHYDLALEMYSTSIQIVKKIYGPHHPELAEILNDIGLVRKKQGRYEEAIKVYEGALIIIEKTFGRLHHKCGLYLTNIADVYRKLAKYEKAEEYYKTATEILEQTLGVNHYEVAEVLNSRAMVLKKKTFYDEAQPLYERALEIIESTFGENHPKYGLYLNNLADLERKRGKYHEALRIYSRALRIIEGSLGEDHSEAADILNNMGLIKIALEYPHDALEFFTRAQTIVVREFGYSHHKVGMYMNNMGDAYYAIKRPDIAENCYFESLVILFKTLGPDHVEVADVLANYANLLVSHGTSTWPKALGMYNKSIEIIKATFGADHPKVVKWSKVTKDLENKGIKVNATQMTKFYELVTKKEVYTEHEVVDILSSTVREGL